MTKIKMFCMLPRRRDVSSQWFHDHWRHPHGTLGRTISTVRNYVQSHQIGSALLGEDQRFYEGVVEVWFDSEADARDLPSHPDYLRYLVPDEPAFIDMDGIRFVFTEEDILVSGPDPRDPLDAGTLQWREAGRATSIKLIQLVLANGGSPWECEDDLDLGRQIGALRHARCTPSLTLHATGCDFVGIRELWWPTVTAFEEGVTGAPDAFANLLLRPAQAITLLAQAERFK
ncbi:EthD domain-containing protein [Sphingosinicella sp. LHD-64]|uniref:EthD domain-containing protein n=1 Tax=Sphingosinicella sp. LHD-64 TaxID=3072139 RepID=UPI00280F975C|nr:EthD domain-containing protein [Sphingosinicella sp. LHD-64]MDQ8757438.1 EthD domain-containing protein [Sphingosinicella sp. LHD-64]